MFDVGAVGACVGYTCRLMARRELCGVLYRTRRRFTTLQTNPLLLLVAGFYFLSEVAMATIIPIRSPENAESVDKVEWVMLELNGELLKPLDEARRTAQQTKSSLPDGSCDNIRRRVELGSVKFDADVSCYYCLGCDICVGVCHIRS